MLKPKWATWTKLKPWTLGIMIAVHGLALAAPFSFTWTGLIVFFVLYWVTGALGITLCYHRLLTHRSFKTPRWVEYILTFFAAGALQGGPIAWVATHRYHHKESDEKPDPHTPRHEGFWWSHLLWNFYRKPDFDQYHDYVQYARDLAKDPVHRFYNWAFFPIYLLIAIAMFGIGFAFGGWKLAISLVVWGCFFRTVMVWHTTWFVNSVTHMWGYRRYKTPDDSRNNWWVALLSFGEGWHNNHHADQRSAAHGHRWYEIDLTYWTIRLMQGVGLAWDVVKPKYLRERAASAEQEAA